MPTVESLAFAVFGVVALLGIAGAKRLDDRDRQRAPRRPRSSFPPSRESSADGGREPTQLHLTDRPSGP